MTRYPAIMGLVSKPAPADAMQAICSDLNYTANHNPQNASGLVLAVMWQLSKYDLGTAWQAMWFPLVSQSTRDKFAAQYCLNGQYVAGPNSQQDDASALVAQNTILQNNCYSTRMANGDDPVNARNICVARYPNSLSWAMSTNHNAEQSCFQTRTANGDDPVNARNICLARYPIN